MALPIAIAGSPGLQIPYSSWSGTSSRALSGTGLPGTGGSSISGYAWTLLSAPAGSSAALTSASTATPVLTGIDRAGIYVVILVVTDNLSNTSSNDPQACPKSALVAIEALDEFARAKVPRPDVTNVREFGATGNGVTDDTAAIQAAIDAASAVGGSRAVFFPTGIYQVTAGVLLATTTIAFIGEAGPSHTLSSDVFGSAQYALPNLLIPSVLLRTASTEGTILTVLSPDPVLIRIDHLGFLCTATGEHETKGLYLHAVGHLTRCSVRDTWVANCLTGFELTSVEDSVFTGINVSGCKVGVHCGADTNSNDFYGFDAKGCDTQVLLDNCAQNRFWGATIQGHVSYGVRVVGGGHHLINGCWFESTASGSENIDIAIQRGFGDPLVITIDGLNPNRFVLSAPFPRLVENVAIRFLPANAKPLPGLSELHTYRAVEVLDHTSFRVWDPNPPPGVSPGLVDLTSCVSSLDPCQWYLLGDQGEKCVVQDCHNVGHNGAGGKIVVSGDFNIIRAGETFASLAITRAARYNDVQTTAPGRVTDAGSQNIIRSLTADGPQLRVGNNSGLTVISPNKGYVAVQNSAGYRFGLQVNDANYAYLARIQNDSPPEILGVQYAASDLAANPAWWGVGHSSLAEFRVDAARGFTHPTTGLNVGNGVIDFLGRPRARPGGASSHFGFPLVLATGYPNLATTGTGEETLASFSIPASAFAKMGDRVVIEPLWRIGTNATRTTQARVKFAGNRVATYSAVAEGYSCLGKITIVKSGTNAQRIDSYLYRDGALASTDLAQSFTETETAEIVVTITGQSQSAGLITLESIVITYYRGG